MSVGVVFIRAGAVFGAVVGIAAVTLVLYAAWLHVGCDHIDQDDRPTAWRACIAQGVNRQ